MPVTAEVGKYGADLRENIIREEKKSSLILSRYTLLSPPWLTIKSPIWVMLIFGL